MNKEGIILWPTQVALFDTRKDHVRIHRRTCRMARTGNPGASVTTLFKQEDIDDLLERGFPVRHCKCCQNI